MYRKAIQAGFFYPGDEKDCKEMLEKCVNENQIDFQESESIVAAIVPHAGWVFSGKTAGKVYYSLLKQNLQPETIIIFGAVHVPGVRKAAIWKEGKWGTPIGSVEIDSDLTQKILSTSKFVEENYRVHSNEHSIEVQIPFIRYFFPNSKIVPIMVPPSEDAISVGLDVANCCEGKKIVALGSTDMTHYGSRLGFTPAGSGKKSLEWVKKENDKRMLDIMLSMEVEKVIEEADSNNNACGSGAISATISFAKKMNKKRGKLLEYTTSWDVYPERDIETFVGYAGVIF